jgi:hypothetical protein
MTKELCTMQFNLPDAIAAVGVMLKDSKTFHGICLGHGFGCADSKELMQFDARRRGVGSLLCALGEALQEEPLHTPGPQPDMFDGKGDPKTHLDETPEGRGEGEEYPDPDDELAAPSASALSESGMGTEIADPDPDEENFVEDPEEGQDPETEPLSIEFSTEALLGLILDIMDPGPTIDVVENWSIEERKEVADWAQLVGTPEEPGKRPDCIVEWLNAREAGTVGAAKKSRPRKALSEV